MMRVPNDDFHRYCCQYSIVNRMILLAKPVAKIFVAVVAKLMDLIVNAGLYSKWAKELRQHLLPRSLSSGPFLVLVSQLSLKLILYDLFAGSLSTSSHDC